MQLPGNLTYQKMDYPVIGRKPKQLEGIRARRAADAGDGAEAIGIRAGNAGQESGRLTLAALEFLAVEQRKTSGQQSAQTWYFSTIHVSFVGGLKTKAPGFCTPCRRCRIVFRASAA